MLLCSIIAKCVQRLAPTSSLIQIGQDVSNSNFVGAAGEGVGIAIGLRGPTLLQNTINNATAVTIRLVSVQTVAVQTPNEIAMASTASVTRATSQSVGGFLAGKALGIFGLVTTGYDLLVGTPAAAIGCYASRHG
jgi:hypothetical protein